MDRKSRLLRTADRSGQIVEIGAGYSPAAAKSDGWQTHVVDHASRDELQAKYRQAGVNVDAIEQVDTVWRAGLLQDAVPADLLGNVDTIVASHVLEHIPDLIGFLQSAACLAAPGGRLSVALPDRRYCFDCLRPWTTTGDLLDAHQRKLRRHSLKTAFDHTAYSALVDGGLAWGPRRISMPLLADSFDTAALTVASFSGDEERPYEDYHAWQFTPAGFELAMLELRRLGLTTWQIESVEGPENFEFFAILRRDDAAAPDPHHLQQLRQSLLIRQMEETREQIDFMLGASDAAPHSPPPNDANYARLSRTLAEQDARLREMAETLAWLRAALRPMRTVWRRLRLRR